MKLKPVKFARQAGVSRQAVAAKIKNNTLAVDAAGFLDTDNPINSAYISEQGRKPRRAAQAPPPGEPGTPAASAGQGPSPPPPVLQADSDVAAAGTPAELLSMTLRELVIKYNGMINLEKHARILRDLTTASEKELRIQERSLKVIEKDFVTSRIFTYIDFLMRQLIEYPESIMDAFVAKALSEGTDCRGELVSMMRDGLGRIIAGAKEQVVKELNSLKGKYTGNENLVDEISDSIREAED